MAGDAGKWIYQFIRKASTKDVSATPLVVISSLIAKLGPLRYWPSVG
ncbi:hypothetical protein Poly51_45420 [Rubripirellula tenax]|uniref:Uncharacterized protein n=1 Tax=Rubripirellula tenax TaxID=2528015 RepID=A0A5C6EM03_9BACT|nr:hypothetical protein Poly51_45420 [Rubripirellula tenax]